MHAQMSLAPNVLGYDNKSQFNDMSHVIGPAMFN
jgi:hypothetical protein